MNHNLSDPCHNCPFRTDVRPYLTAGAIREIVESLFQGASFPCHKTTVDDDSDENGGSRIANKDSEQCAGAEIFLAHQGSSTQLSRIAERLGLPVAELNMNAPVCSSMEEMLKVHGHRTKPKKKGTTGDFCSVCDGDCEAPAGIQCGTGVWHGDTYAKFWCSECGQAVCGACSTGEGKNRICNNCLDQE